MRLFNMSANELLVISGFHSKDQTQSFWIQLFEVGLGV